MMALYTFRTKILQVIFAVTPQSLKEVMEDVIVLGKKQVQYDSYSFEGKINFHKVQVDRNERHRDII